MRRSPPARAACALLALALGGFAGPAPAQGPVAVAEAGAGAAPARIVSLNPSLTAILLALGARDALVGVDAFSARQQPTLAGLPRVGGLYNPSLEAVVALQPDLVVLVPSAEQRDFRGRLEALGVPRLVLDPLGFDEVLASIEQLGARIGRRAAAEARVAAIRRTRARVKDAVRDRPRPRTVLVLQRDPLFVVGSGSFVSEMLEAAGAENLGVTEDDPWPRVSREWLIAARPELLIDSAPGAAEEARAFWAHWPSLPAVRTDRVVAIVPGALTLPGPDLDRALVELARHVHQIEVPLEDPQDAPP